MPGMYDVAPQFQFTQSSLPTMPTTLDQVNPSYYDQIEKFLAISGGRLSSIYGIVLYDTVRVDPGTIPITDFNFFANAENQQQALLVSSTPYTKQRNEVSPWLATGGVLSRGHEALIWEITVQFAIVANPDTTLQTTGNNINLTLDPGLGTPTGKMANTMRAFQESTYFQLFVNETPFEHGPGWRFPAGFYGMSGDAGGLMDGWVNNGCGWPYQMPVMRHLPELTKFGVNMRILNPFVLDAGHTVRIRVALGGLGLGPVTG